MAKNIPIQELGAYSEPVRVCIEKAGNGYMITKRHGGDALIATTIEGALKLAKKALKNGK